MYTITENNFPAGSQIRAARALLEITQEQCAKGAGVSTSSVKNYEALKYDDNVLAKLNYNTIIAILNYLDQQNIKFVNSDNEFSVSFIRE
jgi:DNA-binding XRE family transcriptional regulator